MDGLNGKEICRMKWFNFVLPFLFSVCTFSMHCQIPIPTINDEVKFSDHKWIPFYKFKKSKHSTFFQGNKRKKNYFEGWYFKMVGQDGKSIISVIPGISLSTNGDQKHAFIQIIDGMTGETSYHTFPIDEFYFSQSEFAVRIGQNYFSKEKLILNIDNGKHHISGEVHMSNTTDYSARNLFKRKIMGWYGRLSFLECYHGVVSLTHQLKGSLSVNGREQSFKDGKGYVEKDWGSSMPRAWIWLQSNNFDNPNTSFMISIADVPFINNSFSGFLGFLYYNDEVYRFGTYRRTKVNLEIVDSNNIMISIKNPKETIEIEATRNQTGTLKAPQQGNMDRRIQESIDAHVNIKLYDKKGNLIFSDSSSIAGLELVGDIHSLTSVNK